jgi:hypothetical protein
MLESSVADVIEAGGRHACFAALMLEAAQPLAERVISGSEQQRLGAARIYAANLCVASLRGQCETRLTTLFEDASERVRAAASQCFVQMPQSELDMYSGLMGQFILSPAFVDGAGQLLWTLFRATVPLPAVTCRACARFVDMVGEAAANIATRAGGQAFRVSELLVRAYGQSIGDAELERECLDVIDRVAEVGILGIAEAISKFER